MNSSEKGKERWAIFSSSRAAGTYFKFFKLHQLFRLVGQPLAFSVFLNISS